MSGSSRLLPYLRLVRAPAVFSALGDPLVGLLIARGELPAGRAAKAAAAAASLYLAGMALNDLADREEDARERPERPIPAGEVSARSAALLGLSLLLTGALTARRAGARQIGGALAGMIAAYDFVLKRSPALGPVAMGACRSLSLLMGAEAGEGSRGLQRSAGAALLLGTYIAGLTLLARGETEAGSAAEVTAGAGVAGAALLATALRGGRRAVPWTAGAVALAGPAVTAALRDPVPARVGPAVGAMIRAIPALDGALAAPRAPRHALVLLPLLALVRWGRKLFPIS
ncbi:MAG: UbiA family prenyltransferase [Gemmatimonadetes bacterium]|jgi:4-hydroxybenzoate polyprenyltransferase|nr:UbiA family prenyltransferase [Gemmatimonadota bacterium]